MPRVTIREHYINACRHARQGLSRKNTSHRFAIPLCIVNAAYDSVLARQRLDTYANSRINFRLWEYRRYRDFLFKSMVAKMARDYGIASQWLDMAHHSKNQAKGGIEQLLLLGRIKKLGRENHENS